MVENNLSERTNRLIKKAIDFGIEEAKSCTDDYFWPVLLAHTGKTIEVHRMQTSDPDDASTETNKILEDGDYFAYALIRASFVNCSGEQFDAVCVEASDKNSDLGITVQQRYIKSPEFKIHEEPLLTRHSPNRLLVSDSDQVGQAMVIKAPYAALIIVAGADGKIEDHELKAFKKIMTRFVENSDNEFISTIAQASLMSIRDYVVEIFSDGFETEEVIKESIRYVDQTLSPSQVSEFRLYLQAIAKVVASAKKGFLNFGGKDRTLELQAVKNLCAVMDSAL